MKSSSQISHPKKRYKLTTEKNNQIFVEEVNQNEIETLWKTLSEIQSVF